MSKHQVSVAWLAGFVLATGLLIALQGTVQSSIRWAAGVACLAVVASVLAIVKANPHRPISSGSSYASLFGIFHIGLLIPISIGAPVPLFHPEDIRWVTSPGFASAAVLAAVAQCCFSIGYLVRHRLAPGSQIAIDSTKVSDSSAANIGSGAVGIAFLIMSVSLWNYNTLTSGVSIIGTTYGDFLSLTMNTSMPTTYLLMGLGLGVVSSSRNRKSRRWALIIFALWALPAFTIGLRGEVIIPMSVYAVVAARRRHIILRPWMGLVGIGVLAAGSAVRVIRQFGVRGGTVDFQTFDPFDGITELGYSIRPLTVVVNFHELLSEPFVGIATYLAPFRRVILGRVLGNEVLSAASDTSVFSTMITQRVGTIGGSPAAEAYRSAGVLGVVCVMILIGLLVAHLDSLCSTQLTDAAVGMSTFILLLWVRNDFTPVPAEFAIMGLTMLLIWLIEKGRHKRPCRIQHPRSKLLSHAGDPACATTRTAGPRSLSDADTSPMAVSTEATPHAK